MTFLIFIQRVCNLLHPAIYCRFDFNIYFLSSLADSFETILKSLLGYQSGAGVGGAEALMRKKVYEGAINKTLENNFPLLLKVSTAFGLCLIKCNRIPGFITFVINWFPCALLFAAGRGVSRKVAVGSKVPAHAHLCSPARIGHEGRHSACHGQSFRWWFRSHPLPQEPRGRE